MNRERAALVLLTLIFGGCAREDIVARIAEDTPSDAAFDPPPPGARDAEPSEPEPPPPDGGVVPDAEPVDRCEVGRPPVIVGDSAEPIICGGSIAERTFRFGICTCDGLTLSAPLVTDAFDSSLGPYGASELGGSIGIAGDLGVNALIRVGGSLWVGGFNGITGGPVSEVDVLVDLDSRGPLDSQATVKVGRNARVGGSLKAKELRVAETLTMPPGTALDVTGMTTTATIVRGPVNIPPPCACEPSDIIDVAAVVARHRTDNDDAARGIDPSSLADVSSPTTLPLGCGRYYFTNIAARASLTLTITGRAVIFVDGDISLQSSFDVDIRPGGELDLFVAGNVVSRDLIRFGSLEKPALARLYVGGSSTIELASGGRFGGNLYAPRAELRSSGSIQVFGSVFLRGINASAGVDLHYDTAVLRAANDCSNTPPTTCNGCEDCRSNACIAGSCQACSTDADCCVPLFCVRGQCAASPL